MQLNIGSRGSLTANHSREGEIQPVTAAHWKNRDTYPATAGSPFNQYNLRLTRVTRSNEFTAMEVFLHQ